MRLKIPRVTAEERIIAALNSGYRTLANIKEDYQQRIASKTFDSVADNERYELEMNTWGQIAKDAIDDTFPTELEWNKFLNPPVPGLRTTSADQGFTRTTYRLSDLLGQMRVIFEQDLDRYTDLPQKLRLWIQDIDSFAKVRDVNVAEVQPFLRPGGYLDRSEDAIQIAIEQIIGEPFHKKDWGGEINDLYSGEIRVNGHRTATAFMLKGNGLKSPTMEIADCGKNGDQLLRLFNSPAELFVVQFVGNIAEAVIADVEGKVKQRRAQGHDAHYCIMNGQDTACLLYAYGKII